MKPIVLLALTLGTPALADCPTRADLATGITVTEDDGTAHVFRDLGNGLVEQTGTYSDGYTFRNLLGQGVHVVQLADVEDGRIVPDSILNTAYPARATDLPIPYAGLQWGIDTTVRGFGEIYAERQEQVWGAQITMTIGDCALIALPGKISYASQEGVILETVYYLPQQGMSLLMSYRDPDGTIDEFTYVSLGIAQ